MSFTSKPIDKCFVQQYFICIINISVVMLNARTLVLLLHGVNGAHVNQDIVMKITAFKKEELDHQEELDIKSHQFQVNKNVSRSLSCAESKKCLIVCYSFQS